MLFYDFMNTFKIQISLKEIFQCSIKAHTGTNVAWHELDNYCGGKGSWGNFTKCQKLVDNDEFSKFEVLYCVQNTVKSIKIQWNFSYNVYISRSQNFRLI